MAIEPQIIEVRLLGPLEVLVGGSPVDVPGVRTRAVLARLALDAGSVVAVDQLIDEVWGAAAPVNALNALQVRISQLRQVLGREAVLATRPGYVLDIDPSGVDALAVETLIAAARRTSVVDPRQAAALFAEALSRWRGPPFGGLGDAPFTLGASARWDELRLGATEDGLRLELTAGRVLEHLPELEELAAQHPLREPLHELLIRAYAALGRQADALGAYRRIRGRLVDELGVDPGPRLQELEAGVLRQDPSLVGSSPLSMQPIVEELAPIPAIGNVYQPTSRLLHRGVDEDATEKMLALHQLVTITGPAGVGKTHFAVELACRVKRTHGVWLVSLESTTSPDQVAETIAATLGAPLDRPIAGLCARLRGADMLLVLDNCEHLGDGPASVIRELLENCPSLTVLATSQRPLGVPGEMIWPLRPLPRAGALDLFVLRVAEMNPRIVFDAATLRSADEICAELDDLPLAIELAARRCGVMSVNEIAERLANRFDLLADRSTRRSRRHSTLANAIGWSYELLFPDAQLLLQVVAAFPEGATLEALEVVAPAVGVAADELVDLLTQLADRSFVVTDWSGRASRYRVLNSVRVFANDRADQADRTAAIRSALATWVKTMAKQCSQGLRTSNQSGWLAKLRDERAVVDLVFEWLVLNDPHAALTLSSDLFLGWLITGDNSIAAARLGRALAAAGDAALDLRAQIGARQAVLLARIGRHEESVPIASWALAAVEGSDPHVVALTRSIVGQVFTYAGRLDDGLALMRRAREELSSLGDTWAESIGVHNLALAAGHVGDHEAQGRLTREALELLRDHHDPFVYRLAHRNLALVELRNGRFASALESLQKSLAAERSIGFAAEEVGTLRLLGRAHWLMGQAELAVDSLMRSITTSQQLGDAASADNALADLVALHRAAGDIVAARAVFERFHPGVSSSAATHLPAALQIQIVALALDEGGGGGRRLLELALASTVDTRDNHRQVLALDLVGRLTTNSVDAIAARAEADQLARRMGLHAAERPDRRERDET